MTIEAMIDIETFDTKDTAVVFQIGLIIWDEEGPPMQKRCWQVKVQNQIDKGRTISADTLKFWTNPEISMNAHKALGAFVGEKQERLCQLLPVDALQNIANDIRHYKPKNIWAKGSFDFNILENMFEMYDISIPWKFYQLRDLRTLMKECGVGKQEVVSHNALDDCEQQVKLLEQCRAKSGGKLDESHIIRLNGAEIQSGSGRLSHAEGLILQLPETHEGRNTWLMNYGTRESGVQKRLAHGIIFDERTQSAETTGSPIPQPGTLNRMDAEWEDIKTEEEAAAKIVDSVRSTSAAEDLEALVKTLSEDNRYRALAPAPDSGDAMLSNVLCPSEGGDRG